MQLLLKETGVGIEPDLLEEMKSDAALVSASSVEEGAVLGDGKVHEALLRFTARLGWLHRFARMSNDRIAALAERTGKTVEQIDQLTTLIKGADGWWGVIQWLMNVV